MKIRWISDKPVKKKLLAKPQLKPDTDSGVDAGSRVAGHTQYATGVPHKPRHRKFLGMEK